MFRMFSTYNAQSGFARTARLLFTLVVMVGLIAIVSPAASAAAKTAPKAPVGAIKVHVTTYQHGNALEGLLVSAVSPAGLGEYKAWTDQNGIATLKVPVGFYHVTAQVASLLDPYEPWSQDATVAPGAITKVEARLIISAETYPLKFAAIDSVSLNGVAGATVRIYDTSGQMIAQGLTDAAGLFVPKAPKGIFLATVEHPKYGIHKDYVQIFANKPNSNIVALAPVGEPSLGDMQIHVFDGTPGILTPIQGATVTLYTAKGNKLDQGMTDSTGIYYTCLPEGKYLVEVTAPNYNSYSDGHLIKSGTLNHYKVLLVHPVGW